MYDPKALTPEDLDWALHEAMNELNAYLCEVDFHRMYGDGWSGMAHATASRCRSIAHAATDEVSRQAWIALGNQYEGTIDDVAAVP